MSTVVTENLKRSSEAVARSLRGVAAAWVNFNGTGTVAIRDSQNVSSITDNGTGNYTSNFSASFAAADYAQSFASFNQVQIANAGYTVSASGVLTGFASSLAGATTNQDASDAHGQFMGDLA
jgi:hypothetical protein